MNCDEKHIGPVRTSVQFSPDADAQVYSSSSHRAMPVVVAAFR